jgi:hypothetical protein
LYKEEAMEATPLYQILLLFVGLAETFEHLDNRMSEVLCDKTSDKKMECYLDIVAEKAGAIIALADKVKELEKGTSERERLIRTQVEEWEKEVKEYLKIPKAYLVPCILDQGGKNQIQKYTKI